MDNLYFTEEMKNLMGENGNGNGQIKPYHTLDCINNDELNSTLNIFNTNIKAIKGISLTKLRKLIKNLYTLCRLHYISLENRKLKNKDKMHPIRPIRGEIYNAIITENIGSEINDNHLVVIISNEKTNKYADKINVIPIEGDGEVVPKYLVQIKNNDLEFGNLNKNPSRIIVPEILTIDKARLGLKIGKIGAEKLIELDRKILKQLDIKVLTKNVNNCIIES